MDLNLQKLNQTEFPVPVELEDNIAITSLSQLYNWGGATQCGPCSLAWLAALSK